MYEGSRQGQEREQGWAIRQTAEATERSAGGQMQAAEHKCRQTADSSKSRQRRQSTEGHEFELNYLLSHRIHRPVGKMQ